MVGRTHEEAQAKFRTLQNLIHPAVGLGILQHFFPGVDLTRHDLHGPPPPFARSTNGNTSRLALVSELAQREKLTLRQIYERLAGARGHRVVVGSLQEIADEIESWFRNEGADGFNVMPPVLPESLNDFVELVIPELQRRGLLRSEYEGRTLRENLGLARRENQFAARRQTASATAA